MILANILLTEDDDSLHHSLPPVVLENLESFRTMHANFEHRLFTRTVIRELLKSEYGNEALSCFDQLKPFSYQADLARYCLIYKYGGIYSDLSVYFFRPIPFAEGRLTVFSDFGWESPWDTVNSLFAAPAGHKALGKCIELVCANVKSRYYGVSPLSPTGPVLFGKAIALTCEPEELLPGRSQIVNLADFRENNRHGFVMGKQVIAAKRKGSEGLLELGISGGNIYSGLWQRREVYGEGQSEAAPHG